MLRVMALHALKTCLGALILVLCLAGNVLGELNVKFQVCPKVMNHLSRDQCLDQPQLIDCPQFGCVNGWRCCPTGDTCGVRCTAAETRALCPIPVDIALILDVSGSINDKDWGRVIEALESFVDMYDISEERTHLGVVTYSTNASLMVGFNDFQGVHRHSANLKREIDYIELQPGIANLDKGLRLANEELFEFSKGNRNVKKYCIVLTDGAQSNTGSGVSAHDAAVLLKAKDVTVSIVTVGNDDPSQDLYQIASTLDHVYHARDVGKVTEQLAKIVNNECQGCKNVDVVLGIPNSLDPNLLFDLQTDVNTFAPMFHVTNRFSHIGIVIYNEDASLYRPLGQDYTIQDVQMSINSIQPSLLNGFNTAAAMRVAADHAFTMYGGVRQSYPKVMVLFVPSGSTSSYAENQAAANKLKGMGVRIMIVGVANSAPLQMYSSIVSQPTNEFLVNLYSMSDISSRAYEMSKNICEKPVIKSCFVPFEMVIAIDNSEAVTRNEFVQIKDFVKRLMQPFANSENNAHFGLITYASSPNKLTDGFRQFLSQGELHALLDNLQKTNDPQRRVDLALEAAKRDFFSMEGGTRRGHPRYLVLVASGLSSSVGSETMRIVTQSLEALGVRRISVGVNYDPSTIKFLQNFASENKLVFTAKDNGVLADVAKDIEPHICTEKPGTCPRPQEEDTICHLPIPEGLIPCGTSADKPSQSQQQNDWDCPGELKCCYLDVAKCHQVCRYPPIVNTHNKDLLVLMENTDAFGGRRAFELSKQFVQELVRAFDLSTNATHLSLATYTGSAVTEIKFTNKEFAESKVQALRRIQGLNFKGGRLGNTMEALRVAYDLLQPTNDARFKMHKTVVIVGTGRVYNRELAAQLGSKVRSNLADVFAVTIGKRPDYMALKTVVSTPREHTIFTVTSPDAMRAQLRPLAKAIDDGAIKDYVVSMMTSLS